MPITYPPDQPWSATGPPGCEDAANLFREYGIWYKGSITELADYYRNSWYNGLNVRPSQRAGGLYGFLGRLFWGAPQVGTEGDLERFHVPAAANISALSSDLLYSEQPTITLDATPPAVDRLQAILSDGGVYAVLAQCAELASAYGSAYIRASVDVDLAPYPIAEALPPHCAIPEWHFGRLVAVTFWRVVPDGGGGTLRHLERHEKGFVQHQLRRGSETKLGPVVPLASHQEFARLATLAGDSGVIPTGIPMLDVVHQPNILPNRECPDSPVGRSDYQGVIGEMHALDEVWSRWMDDLRLARSRIVVPKDYLRGLGPGRGATFDPDQRVFTAVESLDPQQPMQIEVVQFEIRVDEHDRTARGLWRILERNAGLSADAFGEESSGAQATATEIGQRGARTVATRARKIDYALPAVRGLAEILAAYDARYFPGAGSESGVTAKVQFPDGVTVDPVKNAQTIQYLDAAGALSLRVKVAMAHPDWDGDEIDAEVAAIQGEQASIAVAAPADPGTFDTPAPDPMMPPADPAMNGNRMMVGG